MKSGFDITHNGETCFKVAHNSQLPITNYQLPITNYQLPITNYQLPITNYQLPITLPITN
ncbi:MAG: hypothetical protein JGK24_07205 [Microcoleus sp. PH2017_29_MFU_D_A]|uniref:hypothetical protein n=1 Tax=Microcoleus sp. PH2017_29_MFU_D_A TaxID=2798839 RepID=UPI001DFEB191|nr:hypothetical protein [Microcoleus sp. PH2017_29_MFU_D_A]MCC3603021.1 hypothetical protein [Microcoleus sp. PH2017_29_MFU_D_A]